MKFSGARSLHERTAAVVLAALVQPPAAAGATLPPTLAPVPVALARRRVVALALILGEAGLLAELLSGSNVGVVGIVSVVAVFVLVATTAFPRHFAIPYHGVDCVRQRRSRILPKVARIGIGVAVLRDEVQDFFQRGVEVTGSVEVRRLARVDILQRAVAEGAPVIVDGVKDVVDIVPRRSHNHRCLARRQRGHDVWVVGDAVAVLIQVLVHHAGSVLQRGRWRIGRGEEVDPEGTHLLREDPGSRGIHGRVGRDRS